MPSFGDLEIMACLAHLPARTRLIEATCLESDGSEQTRFIRPHELKTFTTAPVTWNGESAMLRFRHRHASMPVNTRATQLLAAASARLGAARPSPLLIRGPAYVGARPVWFYNLAVTGRPATLAQEIADLTFAGAVELAELGIDYDAGSWTMRSYFAVEQWVDFFTLRLAFAGSCVVPRGAPA
jgi:hypothetical protein